MNDLAGIVLYRFAHEQLTVLVGHRGHPRYANVDQGAWSIPKGKVEAGEGPFAAALREFEEEIGHPPPAHLEPLPCVQLTTGHLLWAWSGEDCCEASTIERPSFRSERPVGAGEEQELPEFDRVAWMPIDRAAALVSMGQHLLLAKLVAKLDAEGWVDAAAYADL